jgi:hypothetical protein
MRQVAVLIGLVAVIALVPTGAMAQLIRPFVEVVDPSRYHLAQECDPVYEQAIVVLVRNTLFVPRMVEIRVDFQDGNDRLRDSRRWQVNLSAGESALVGECISAITPPPVTVRPVAWYGHALPRVLGTLGIRLDSPDVQTWHERGGYGLRAAGSVLVHNAWRHDLRLSGWIRLYNAEGHQVALCDIVSKRVLAGSATRIGCDVWIFDTIVDTPVRARFEISSWD